MVALGVDKVERLIRTIGLFRTKARNVVALSRKLVEEFGGEVPRRRATRSRRCPASAARRRTSSSTSPSAQPTMAVDTHIFRVANRTGLAPGHDPLAVELGLEKVVPDEYKLHAHHWLILHGRYVCKARKPECPRCIVNDICRYPDKTM